VRVCWHRRELHVRLLGDGARLGDFGGDAGNALDLVFGDDRLLANPQTPP
jgi:hypothetical protein